MLKSVEDKLFRILVLLLPISLVLMALILSQRQDAHAADAPSISNTRELSNVVLGSANVSCADNDAGTANTCNLAFPGVGTVFYTCSDANGCTAVPVETGAWDGYGVKLINKGSNTLNVADTAGLTELAGAAALGQYDTLTLVYSGDRFVEVGRTNN